ncbi:MAG: hypothetical protein VX701_03550 [Chloroflexota bacterium]|nr:hypothetical protein [Chloroflexota bacterium]
MTNDHSNHKDQALDSTQEIIVEMRARIFRGDNWLETLLKAIAIWPTPESTVRKRKFRYLIAGEALDWLLLAERLCLEINDLVDRQNIKYLVCYGHLPKTFRHQRFKEILGGQKYSAYMNYFYGVTVEEALQLSVENELFKQLMSNGKLYKVDVSDDIYLKLYGSPMRKLIDTFRTEVGTRHKSRMTLYENKEFTYWLFKLRLNNSDKARTASDTVRGLRQLSLMNPDQYALTVGLVQPDNVRPLKTIAKSSA